MEPKIWTQAIHKSADPKRARHFLNLFAGIYEPAKLKNFSAEQVHVLVSVFGGSQALSALLVAHPDWSSSVEPDALRFPRRKQGLLNEVSPWLEPLLNARDYNSALARLRLFKQHEMLRIGARDLSSPGHPEEITQEISDLADVCLESVWRICWSQLRERYGDPWHQDVRGEWRPTASCIIGLGKLGGQELNYSSDVDIIFVYEEEGTVFKRADASVGGDPPRWSSKLKPAKLTNHQFFNRLAESFVGEVTRLAPEGMLYRIDLRLRPEGKDGPLSRSLESYETYYAQWGQTWERMMLIKARGVAGEQVLASEFLEMAQPFRYPRSRNENVLREIAQIKVRIEQEVVKAGELERNVKLGRGGIREIEFVTQVSQLLHAGAQPFLQGSQTLPALQKLAQYELLKVEEARKLTEAYRFLRDLEHRLQMEDNLQTHTIPSEVHARERLARLMGFSTLNAFESAYQSHTREVRALFDKILKVQVPDTETASEFPRDFVESKMEWEQILAAYGFREIPKAFRVLREFVEGPGYVHVSSRTKDLAFELLPRLFAKCGTEPKVQILKTETRNPHSAYRLSDPDRVVTRLDGFIAAYGARGTLFELWSSNPAIFELLVKLFDRSEFLAEMAIRTPDLVDELVISGRLRQRKSAEETLRDLEHGLPDADQHQWLRRYHRAELMRIGLRDILGLAESEQYLTELSALADACIRYAMEVVMHRHRLKKPPLVIVGMGKLGGEEIDYGSDLDLLFVAGSNPKDLTRVGRLAVEVMDLLSTRTEDGIVFHTDARLRPDGEKGLLVNTLSAYEEYYRRRSQLWEIQSLTRARPIAGDMSVGDEFRKTVVKLTNFGQPSLPLAAFGPDWKQKIHQMRMRIEKERTPKGKDHLAIKTGKGGLMDAEFIAQILCLQHGWQEPNTLRALERGRDSEALPMAEKLIENYRKLRRVEGILRRWSYEGETVLPDQPAPYLRVSIRCGFETAEAFRDAIVDWRKVTREAYLKVLGR